MANTITNTTLMAGRRVVKYITLSSDGTEETATVIYDSSAVSAQDASDTTDPLDCTIESIYAVVSAAATARITLLWDATTDVLAFNIPAGTTQVKADFRREIPMGGLPNQGGSGKTGDILLTTTGLEAGDSLTLVMVVRRD